MNYITGLTSYLPEISSYVPFLKQELSPVQTKSLVSLASLGHTNCSEMWIMRLAGLSGALAVGFGAYGTHILAQNSVDKRRVRAFETGNRYHFIHTLAMVAAVRTRYPWLSASLFLAGIVMFSGTIYHYSLSGKENLKRYTPIGGTLFIAAWLSMMLVSV